MPETEQCVLGATNKTRILGLEVDTNKQWLAIEEIKKRPPVWATAIISVLSFLLGCSLTYAALIK